MADFNHAITPRTIRVGIATIGPAVVAVKRWGCFSHAITAGAIHVVGAHGLATTAHLRRFLINVAFFTQQRGQQRRNCVTTNKIRLHHRCNHRCALQLYAFFFGVGIIELHAQRKITGLVVLVTGNHTHGHLPGLLLVRQLQRKRRGKVGPDHIFRVGQRHVHGLGGVATFVGAFKVRKRPAVHFANHSLFKRLVRNVAVGDFFVHRAGDGQTDQASLLKMSMAVGGFQGDVFDGKIAAVLGHVKGVPGVGWVDGGSDRVTGFGRGNNKEELEGKEKGQSENTQRWRRGDGFHGTTGEWGTWMSVGTYPG
jgi:hypothetical protein